MRFIDEISFLLLIGQLRFADEQGMESERNPRGELDSSHGLRIHRLGVPHPQLWRFVGAPWGGGDTRRGLENDSLEER